MSKWLNNGKKLLLSLFNDIRPKKFGRWENEKIILKSYKCSDKKCPHWARYTWWEEAQNVFSNKTYSIQKYSCYYHLGRYKNLL